MRKLKLAVVTAADGTATAFMNKVSGKVHSVQYLKDGTNAYADTVDIALTAESTGESIWSEANVTASATRYPRAPVHTQAGVAALYAAGGTAILDKIAISNERIKIALAQGGNAKTGTFIVLVDE
jgi:hypothetical protein